MEGQQTTRTADERQASRQEQSSRGKKKGAPNCKRPKPRDTREGGGAATTRDHPAARQETQ